MRSGRRGRVPQPIEAQEQARPNSDFSDNDASKPEDEDFNSDSSSADSNSGKRDMNVYMTYGKKK